jgi:HD superfamily phosphodiesterase
MKTDIIKKMIKYFGSDVKRINHSLKVLSFAQIIIDSEFLDEPPDTIIYSVILHDIGIKEAEKKYNSSSGKYQEIEGPIIARRILKDLKIDEEIINRICFIIGNHHSYQEINGLDFQIVVEADFLVNIFEDQLDEDAIDYIYKHIFQTDTGQRLLKTMYLS